MAHLCTFPPYALVWNPQQCLICGTYEGKPFLTDSQMSSQTVQYLHLVEVCFFFSPPTQTAPSCLSAEVAEDALLPPQMQ